MKNKSFDVFIQCCFSKFLFIDKFDLSNSWQSFIYNIRPLDKLFLQKLYVYITKSKKKHFKDHFQSGIYYQEGFLKELSLIELIFYLKVGQNYFKSIENKTINFLSPNIDFSYFEAQFSYIDQSHSIDFTA